MTDTPETHPQDREQRYAEALADLCYAGKQLTSGHARNLARLVIAVADAEQTELRAEVERLRVDLDFWKPRPPKCPRCGDTTVLHNSAHLKSGPRWECGPKATR